MILSVCRRHVDIIPSSTKVTKGNLNRPELFICMKVFIKITKHYENNQPNIINIKSLIFVLIFVLIAWKCPVCMPISQKFIILLVFQCTRFTHLQQHCQWLNPEAKKVKKAKEAQATQATQATQEVFSQLNSIHKHY